MRHDDATWDDTKHFRWRALREVDGRPVGWVQVAHARWAFVPDTYWLDMGVVPEARRRGHGAVMYRYGLRVLADRGARRLRSGTKESMADGLEFLLHRGFAEVKRDWESRLHLGAFDFTRFSGARERIEADGVRITTLREEIGRDPDGLRKAYELAAAVQMDVPSVDTPTPVDFDTWKRMVLEGPNTLPEAYFIAIDRDGRYLGLSDLERSDGDPTFLWQGLTGVRRDARGRGIAMALKLETVRYAKERGVEHIKTWNDQRNRPMLSINEALGFEKQPAWIQLQKDLEPARA
jgi:GNAT superfamily N-acetyltransferase